MWLVTAQGKSGYRDRWKTSYFEPWVSESEEAGLLYHLANDLNCAVIAEAHQWRLVAGWAALLGVSMINSKPNSELTLGKESLNFWREKLCTLFSDILSLESAINGFSAGYFDDHDVLFKDSREQLTQCKESAELLILGYNQFAEENGIEPINLVVVEQRTSRKIGEHLRTFATLARSHALVSAGKLLDAHEEILSLLNSENPTAEIDRSDAVRI